MRLSLLAPLALLLVSSAAFCHPTDQVAPMPKEFDTLKQLAGSWEGTTTEDGKEKSAAVEYRVTSGGSVLIETLFPGKPDEMVSVYHRQGKTLAMTHYCALGNHPEMAMKKAGAKTFSFEMTKTQGVDSRKEPHMHAITLTLVDADTLRQEWTHFMDGKAAGTVVFNFKRKH